MRAQRLSASQRSARLGDSSRRSRCTMCSTPFGITEVGTPSLRLSRHAWLRAQRLSASQRSARDDSRAVADGIARAQRLSASQRSAHVVSPADLEADRACSTPFGITEVGTRRRAIPVRVTGSAQRLSASQRSARRRPGAVSGPSAECSTPFGITEVGTSGLDDCRTVSASGAQRLSASQRSAQVAASAELAQTDVLNAFRHHRGRHAAPAAAPSRR